MFRLIVLLGIAAFGASGQNNPLETQFQRLMGQPQKLVNDLVNFPWRTEVPDGLQGLRQVTPGPSIRIASVEQAARNHSRWKHWESDDGTVWVDLVTFNEPYSASETLRSARQRHSGYHWANQLLLFSETGNRRKEALGAALIGGNGTLLNVGLKLPIEIHWVGRYPRPTALLLMGHSCGFRQR